MSKKEYIGITYDETALRIAKLRIRNKKPVLISTQSIELTSSLYKDDQSDPDSFNSEEADDLFNFDKSDDISDPKSDQDEFDILDNILEEQESDRGPEVDNLDFEEEDLTQQESDKKRSNELLLTEYFEQSSASKLITGLHIPFGKTTFQSLKGVNPDLMKKRELHEFFSEKLRPIHNIEVEKDQYSWIKYSNTGCLLAYSPESFELISLTESVQEYTKKKVIIQERLPDESIWAGMVRFNYNPSEEEITGLIAIGKTSSRVMFMKGDQILYILPIIPEGEESSIVLNTIFSKILFELDKGDLPKIDRLLLVQSSSMSEMAKVYFQRQFDNIEIELLELNESKIDLADPPEQTDLKLQPYMTAIGAALAASNIDSESFSDFSLVPDSVKEKQQLYKIDWHGVIILILIGITPLFLNHQYQLKSDELDSLEQRIELTEIQIENLRPLAELIDRYQFQTNMVTGEIDRILGLAEYSHEWSDVIKILNRGTSDLSGLWFSSIRNNSNNLSLTGFSLTREALPELARLFTDVNILNVSETEIREQRVYNFTMTVLNFRQDIPSFSPELPVNESRHMELEDTSGMIAYGLRDTVQSTTESNSEVPQEREVPESESAAEPVSETEAGVEPISESINVAQQSESTESAYGLRVVQSDTITGSYTIVVHSLQNENRALNERQRIEATGFKSVVMQVELPSGQTTWRVGIGQFASVVEALDSAGMLPSEMQEDYFISRIL
ncbi:MAG: SPOR domain-containing protein [Balneolaceae bacterium]